MPKIDFDNYEKQEESKEYSVSKVHVSDDQYYVRELDVVFDVIDLTFDGKGPGMEILISSPGDDFKLSCGVVPKDEFDNLDVPSYLISLAEEYIPCLECKRKFLEMLCDDEDEKA